MQARGVFPLHFAVLVRLLPKVVRLRCCLVLAERIDVALSQSVLSAQIRLHGPVSQGHRIALFFCHLMHLHPLALCRHFQWDAFAKGEIGRDPAGPFTAAEHRAGGRPGRPQCTNWDDHHDQYSAWWAGWADEVSA